jgi:hypothetical protein
VDTAEVYCPPMKRNSPVVFTNARESLWRSIKLHSSALSLRSWLEVNLIYKCGAPCVSANPVVSGALQIGLDGSIIRHLLSKSQPLFMSYR